MSRIADGIAIPGTDVVAADVTALLAGVSFNSTRKVMIALDLLHRTKGIPFEELLKAEALPTAAANSERRLDATTDFVHSVLPHPACRDAKEDLKLRRFFTQ